MMLTILHGWGISLHLCYVHRPQGPYWKKLEWLLCLEYVLKTEGWGFLTNDLGRFMTFLFICQARRSYWEKLGNQFTQLANSHSLRFIIFVLVVKFALTVISLVGIIHFFGQEVQQYWLPWQENSACSSNQSDCWISPHTVQVITFIEYHYRF